MPAHQLTHSDRRAAPDRPIARLAVRPGLDRSGRTAQAAWWRRPSRPLRAVALVLASAWTLILGGAPAASAFTIAPESGGSPNANSIHTIYMITLVFAIVIFVGVEGALLYCLVRFRARKGMVAAQIHGNTRLELGWTLGAAGVLVVLAVVTFVKLGSVVNPPNSAASAASQLESLEAGGPLYATSERRLPPNGKRLEISVVGRQYIWQFVYPGGVGAEGFAAPYSYEEMVVPTETTVVLNAASVDVVHSWWVPELGGKIQLVPGYHNYTWFKIPAADAGHTFRGQCASLCGRGHARMIATVRAVKPAEFESWLSKRKQELAAADAEASTAREKLSSHTGPESVENP
ncbi:MAG: cytochrome c oxidase subunit II [Acidobacteriota bacterium]|nr:cytochrome c oxidase subunit II [Acidobacteriota bacterium]